MRQLLLRRLVVLCLVTFLGYGGYVLVARLQGSELSFTALQSAESSEPGGKPSVLGIADSISNMIFRVNIPARFDDTVTFSKPISAPNLIEALEAGTGISVSGNKITNAGIVTLAAGSGISVSGNTITNTGITSLSAGTNISIDGNKITNTYSAPAIDYTLSGWTDSGTTIKLSTITDYVGIGIATPTSALHVVGSTNLAGDVTLGVDSGDAITINGGISAGSLILPINDLGADLGSVSKRFNNLWVANINSNSSQAFSGQTTFSYPPTDTTISQASVLINPTSSAANGQLLGLGIAGYQKALIDEDGDIILGYSDATSAPASDYPLNIYGHSGTRVAYIDTSGNTSLSGTLTLTSTSGLTFSGVGGDITFTNGEKIDNDTDEIVTITSPTTALSGDLTFTDNNWLGLGSSAGLIEFDDQSTDEINFLNANVGIGTSTPGSELEIYSADGTLSGVKFSSSTAGTNYSVGVGDGSPFNDALIFVANATQYAFMNSSGNWGYGFAGTPGSRLSVSGGLSLGSSYVSTAAPTDGAIIQGNVGIGTTAPTVKLDIAATTGVDALRLTNAGAKVLGLSFGTNNIAMTTASTDPTNKLLNSTFDTDLTSWSEVPSYTLNDQFTTDRATGAVNGTAAEPTGGTRTVTGTDTVGISGSQLNITTGGNDTTGIKYSSQSRVAGKILIVESPSQYFKFAFGGGGYISNLGFMKYSNTLSTNGIDVGSVSSSGVTYKLAIVLRGTGEFYYIKGGAYTNWTLVYINNTLATSTLYPAYQGLDSGMSYTADNIRIPSATWLPTPLAYDTFTRGDGAIGSSEVGSPDGVAGYYASALAWTGGAISTNKNVITPSVGSDIVVNGNFSSWTGDNPDSWSLVGTEDASNYVTQAGPTGQARIVSNGTAIGISQDSILTSGTFYQVTGDVKTVTSGAFNFYLGSHLKYSGFSSTGVKTYTGKATSTVFQLNRTAAEDITIDDLAVKPITMSSTFSSVSTSDSDVIADANITYTAGTQAGLVLNLDSTSSPANYVIAYIDNQNLADVTQAIVTLDKVVGGVNTNVQVATAVTYSPGATLRVIKDGTKYRVYYNNALVGSEQTISDAGIISNTKHGLFSTYAGNSFDNFTLWPRGSSTTKYTSAPFEELTATRNTSTAYNNSTASVQLVAGVTDANYLQSVNVGDTQTYNLIAYAYTSGAAVTTADLALYYDAAELSTTYTPMGGTGWYKLTGSFTGVNAAKNYGVRVRAGKTVYVDDMKVQVGVGTAQTFYVMNTSTGITGLNVQGLVNGTQSGVATFSKAGTISDSDFATASDGLMGIDTTNHRIYFREGGAWSYAAKAGGFQIPNYEAGGLTDGDYLIPYVDYHMGDGAVHGLYAKWSEVKDKLLAEITLRITKLEEIFDKFTTKELCVGESNSETCLSREQVNELLKLIPTATPVPSPSMSPEATQSATMSATITP